jgi:hypothetical protein
MYTLCSYVLKLHNWKRLLFMTFLKSPDSLTHPVLRDALSVGGYNEVRKNWNVAWDSKTIIFTLDNTCPFLLRAYITDRQSIAQNSLTNYFYVKTSHICLRLSVLESIV